MKKFKATIKTAYFEGQLTLEGEAPSRQDFFDQIAEMIGQMDEAECDIKIKELKLVTA